VNQGFREQLSELPLEDMEAFVVAGRAQRASSVDGEMRALPRGVSG
jgi:hypothetical protein